MRGRLNGARKLQQVVTSVGLWMVQEQVWSGKVVCVGTPSWKE